MTSLPSSLGSFPCSGSPSIYHIIFRRLSQSCGGLRVNKWKENFSAVDGVYLQERQRVGSEWME